MSTNKRLLFLTDTKEALDYVSVGVNADKKRPIVMNPNKHAEFISRRIQECRNESTKQTQVAMENQVAAIKYKEGMYLEFSGVRGYELAFKSLENTTDASALVIKPFGLTYPLSPFKYPALTAIRISL